MTARLYLCLHLACAAFITTQSPVLLAQENSSNFRNSPPVRGVPNTPANNTSAPSSPSGNGNSGNNNTQTPPPSPVLLNTSQPARENVTMPGLAVSDDYVLAASDVISITVYGEPDLTVPATRIDKKGIVEIPLLGSVKLGSMTIAQAKTRVTSLFEKDYLVNPQVVVSLLNTTTTDFIMTGKFARPGTYPYPQDGKMTLLKAISNAGGFAPAAKVVEIKIKRSYNNKESLTVHDYKKIMKGDAPDPEIKPGDIITVDESFFGFDSF